MDSSKGKLTPTALLQKPVWTARRRWLGNLIPLAFAVPPLLLGLAWLSRTGMLVGPGLILVGLAAPLGLVATNLFGLYQNDEMKRQMETRLNASGLGTPSRRYFVGAATPNYRGLIDPHEDVGHLLIFPDRLVFFGEALNITLPKDSISEIVRTPNVHSAIGLGGWTTVKAVVEEREIELRFEPRIYKTLLKNKVAARKVAKRLRAWLA